MLTPGLLHGYTHAAAKASVLTPGLLHGYTHAAAKAEVVFVHVVIVPELARRVRCRFCCSRLVRDAGALQDL